MTKLNYTTGQNSNYDKTSACMHDLICRNRDQRAQAAFDAKRTTLRQAFGLPDTAYRKTTLAEVLARNRKPVIVQD